MQVYFAPSDPQQPVRLVGWASAGVAAGQKADVTVACDRRMWRRWDAAACGWDMLPDAG